MQLLLARVGAGKTLAVQDALLALKHDAPLAKVWALLSTERQIVDFRRRVMERQPARSVLFNVEFFNFYSLYHHLLASAGNPQRLLDDTARLGLIRELLADLYREGGGIFGGIAVKPGFVRVVSSFIYELKQNLIEPEAFKAAARTSKEVELAYIYAEYQRALMQHDLVDREGEGWLALDELEQSPALVRSVDLLLVDGYDQFNRLQAELLTLLGAQVGASVTTLTTVPGRETTIGARFADALERLHDAHARRGVPLEILGMDGHDERPDALRHLSEQLLRPAPPQVPADGAVDWIEAPDPAREVGAVLRRVKRLLLGGAASPGDVLIALRDWSLYGGQVAAQGAAYGLPLALHYGAPLAQNPAVVALLDLLGLHAGDFRRRDLLDALRSPYFAVPGLGANQVALLERIALEFRATGGRADWLDALELAARPAANDADDEDAAPDFQLPPTLVSGLRGALVAFFDAVTPPTRATVPDYVAWLEALIGQDAPDAEPQGDGTGSFFPLSPLANPAFGWTERGRANEVRVGGEGNYTLAMPACIRAEADETIVTRDLAAMQQFKQVLRGLLAAQALTGALGYGVRREWNAFFRDLRAAVDNTTVERGAARDGRVLVTTVADARGLPHRHVFILGLSEGLFPQPVPEDPLLLDSERQRLRAAGIDLATQAERAGDDGLFYSLIGQAGETLTLSRPHSKNGEPWAASHLWRAARAVYADPPLTRLKAGAVPDDPATSHEAALLSAERLNRGQTPLWVEPGYWARIRRGRVAELRRMQREPHDQYSGRLHDPALIAWVSAALDERHVWSASQLNDYGVCGFRFFASRLLGLEALEEPEAGMDSRQLGTLYHEILETTYRKLGGVILPERTDEALAVLRETADEKMTSAPVRLRFRPSFQWPQEQAVLRRRLEKLIRDDFGGDSPLDKKFEGAPREIYRQEARFGEDSPFRIDLAGESLRLRGSIDRIDRQGDRVIVVDYKTGGTRFDKGEIERGRNFQMLVYWFAAQAVIDADAAPDAPRSVAGGLFWQIGRDALGDLRAEDDAEDVIAAGKEHLARYLGLARSGDFAAHANRLDAGKCAAYCDFHQMCRQSIMAKGKP